MEGAGAVDADPYGETLFSQKGAPFLVEKGPVGLETVQAAPPVRQVAPLKLDRPAVERHPRQCRLAPVPDKMDDRAGAGLGEGGHEGFQDLIGHLVVLVGGEEVPLA